MIFSETALQNEHVLITGATGGIGYETAKVIASMGASVTITGRNENKLADLRKEMEEVTDKICVHPTDITSDEARRALVEAATDKLGFISGLVNSAGVAGNMKVEEMDESFLEELMDLNYYSAVMLSKQVYKKMIENERGAIVNVSSLSGLRGTFANTSYAGSKFALIGFTQSFAVEAIEQGIRVNAVSPGFVNTEMGRQAIQRKASRNNRPFDEQMEDVKAGLPSGRITEPEEVANTIAFLLTDAARNIVGESVKISGGSVMR
ncbi:SDR family NAD(P)-dependent oxidoreductase [Natribacillus halophilus]|uniref:3-oxoacyl-[acyl-carrier protein] reductase n=1 Tax=Natribacillus halophilus TaxID=549003 RepID=A0A1G8LVK7_9BACI|nr:SDR family oxidoreductase [Natribacillus halophilus]SDI59698.1 3-oxoacyl-[acyl-carrier protein] reductase [Natribacillus halophilus]